MRAIDGTPVAVEVELARKSAARLSAILELHALWRSQGKTGGVLYVCGTGRDCERVQRLAERHGLCRGKGGLGLRTLEEVRPKRVSWRPARGRPLRRGRERRRAGDGAAFTAVPDMLRRRRGKRLASNSR
jgi:hypothetical protein